ncbi:hypothetical protein K438DRAFT_1780325 [Mycena galopus ATCC 62051]|nr:hypothetical protein K438DRAFT_1780325 [Mycena galopus ATCC 62051]
MVPQTSFKVDYHTSKFDPPGQIQYYCYQGLESKLVEQRSRWLAYQAFNPTPSGYKDFNPFLFKPLPYLLNFGCLFSNELEMLSGCSNIFGFFEYHLATILNRLQQIESHNSRNVWASALNLEHVRDSMAVPSNFCTHTPIKALYSVMMFVHLSGSAVQGQEE